MSKVKLGRYIPGDSWIHNLDPRTKLLGSAAMVMAVLLDDSWWVLLLNTFFIFVILYLADIPMRSVLHGVKWLWIFFAFTFVFQALYVQGEPQFHLGTLVFSKEGIRRGTVTFLRFLVLYLSSTLLTMTTSPMKMAGGLESLFSPLNYIKVPVSQFAMLITISLRFIPTIIEEAEAITRAQKSRGAPFHSPKKMVRLKTTLAVLVPLLVGSLQRATDLAAAMESRCYTGGPNYSRLKSLRFCARDFLALAFVLVICILPLF